ncbi:hypothetical protein [Vibrio parahaemolyticus]|uniref:hypothetical protein n=1 Tax=Vibrio parahaemolyticus TaxID=670 RepID=UPI0003FAE1D7|nr:hypothetical protein [Vibrio parahaemolyticus]KJR19707.1 hypothetical protein UF29_11440 [Vibrio parahaemolyticus]HCE2689024.1 hypothetical protein [Vibrio parahaemolyticus]HCE2914146.1 hypothetical protein [Vibrio parahaemolyticus]HCG8556032.1 hypothetical protein [Vibrio parahaemolyticus]HCH0053250.1 hypothetical protein [Vibrio parahaemolyticus]
MKTTRRRETDVRIKVKASNEVICEIKHLQKTLNIQSLSNYISEFELNTVFVVSERDRETLEIYKTYYRFLLKNIEDSTKKLFIEQVLNKINKVLSNIISDVERPEIEEPKAKALISLRMNTKEKNRIYQSKKLRFDTSRVLNDCQKTTHSEYILHLLKTSPVDFIEVKKHDQTFDKNFISYFNFEKNIKNKYRTLIEEIMNEKGIGFDQAYLELIKTKKTSHYNYHTKILQHKDYNLELFSIRQGVFEDIELERNYDLRSSA